MVKIEQEARKEEKAVLVSLQGVSKDYSSGEGRLEALKDVNLDIYQNEFVVVLGESGCGKTTLMNLIGGMDFPTEGRILVEGRDFSAPSDAELTAYRRKTVGYIFQSYSLMPNLTALENVQFIAELVADPMDAREAIDRVGLTERAGHYPGELSVGQQQRVAIARAIVNNPSIVIADEPTGNLDPETSWDIMDIFRRINKAGTTIVMATHDRNIVDTMKRRVIAIEGGRIVRDQQRGGYGYEA